jgi:phosphoribosylaminoimidazole-succinocarboxamide synthase
MDTKTLSSTNFNFPNQKSLYKGKVRDVYNINNEKVILIASDRISAFDYVLPKGIPYKGEILNQMAVKFLKATENIVPNWLLDSPDPSVSIGHFCEPFKVEMVIRGYLAGHAWREYQAGKRTICGVSMPNGMKQNDKFPTPIITPATKAMDGDHDEDISREAIIAQGIISEQDYIVLEKYTRVLFEAGNKIANKQGLILVDTKYEFGKKGDEILLIDEIHTPDSSRYFYADDYAERQANDETQKQLSKEFVREWLMELGFQGKDGQKMPDMPDEFVNIITDRYIELFEKITGEKFIKNPTQNPVERIEKNILNYLNQ